MIHRTRVFLLLGTFLFGAASVRADLGPLEPVADLHRALRDSLGLPEPLIVQALERGLPDVELPVVGMIAVHASVPVAQVVDLRLGGMSYYDMTRHYELSPEIYRVPFDDDPGPPYGNAWGYWKKTPRAQWRTHRMADAEIVDYANLKLVVDHYHVAPVEVVSYRKAGKGYAAIHTEVVKVKGGKSAKVEKSSGGAASASKSKSAKTDKSKSAKGSKGAKGAKDKPKEDKPPTSA